MQCYIISCEDTKGSSNEIFTVYEHEDIGTGDIDQQIAQSSNVGSSSRSYDREMQVQLEEIVRTM